LQSPWGKRSASRCARFKSQPCHTHSFDPGRWGPSRSSCCPWALPHI